MVDRLTETFELIAGNPRIGTQMDRYRQGLRAISVGNYVVFFQASDEGVLVYRVLHGARNFEELL